MKKLAILVVSLGFATPAFACPDHKTADTEQKTVTAEKSKDTKTDAKKTDAKDQNQKADAKTEKDTKKPADKVSAK